MSTRSSPWCHSACDHIHLWIVISYPSLYDWINRLLVIYIYGCGPLFILIYNAYNIYNIFNILVEYYMWSLFINNNVHFLSIITYISYYCISINYINISTNFYYVLITYKLLSIVFYCSIRRHSFQLNNFTDNCTWPVSRFLRKKLQFLKQINWNHLSLYF